MTASAPPRYLDLTDDPEPFLTGPRPPSPDGSAAGQAWGAAPGTGRALSASSYGVTGDGRAGGRGDRTEASRRRRDGAPEGVGRPVHDRRGGAHEGAASGAVADLFGLLRSVLPDGLDQYVLGSSAAEVCDVALRAVRRARPARRQVAVAAGGHHGVTLGRVDGMVEVPYGDAEAMGRALADRSVAAVFLEPVLDGPGLTVPPRGYVGRVAEACARTGTLLVADEFQTCLGRTGRMFAVDHDAVVPDVMLLSKAGAGFPRVGVCALGTALAGAVEDHPLPHGGPSALSLAAACAAVRETADLDLPAHAARLGPRLLAGLEDACRRHPAHLLGAVGTGLMTGLRTRDSSAEFQISMMLAGHGLRTGHSRHHPGGRTAHPVLPFCPPLTVTERQIDHVLAALEATLTWLDGRPRPRTGGLGHLLRGLGPFRTPTDW
ncbi:aminotransferase class III-fold pyridoxal phosphate-dependent enzyme [Streptomyces sp. NPDC053069]|uniref:aminotransferase class III-fold pyridoxal phosphate-dependent enzyme n=1 Tax=Streptomyces sp. NPDC053069 TaxID=3365695 RepID=UPI0037CE7601